MPSKRAAKDWLDFEIQQGRGDDPCHVVDIKREAKKRSVEPTEATRFQMDVGENLLYREFNAEKDRIIQCCQGQKTIALTLMLWAWRQLDQATVDKLRAAMEGPDA